MTRIIDKINKRRQRYKISLLAASNGEQKSDSKNEELPSGSYYSFEFFPPKTEAGLDNLLTRIDRMDQSTCSIASLCRGLSSAYHPSTMDLFGFSLPVRVSTIIAAQQAFWALGYMCTIGCILTKGKYVGMPFAAAVLNFGGEFGFVQGGGKEGFKNLLELRIEEGDVVIDMSKSYCFTFDLLYRLSLSNERIRAMKQNNLLSPYHSSRPPPWIKTTITTVKRLCAAIFVFAIRPVERFTAQ
jgi:hypothetical protein